jgi:hypothetical protein
VEVLVPVSKKQRRWAHTAAGRKALGAEKAEEWGHATDSEIAENARKEKHGHARAAAARGLASRMGGKP